MRLARLICLAVAASTGTSAVVRGDDPPPRRYEVVTPKDDAIVAVALNARGDLVGFEWREDPQFPGVIGQDPFFARGKRQVFLPLLPTYTATFPAALSDDGLVVGRASKPTGRGGRVPLQSQAFTWTEADGIRGLGTLPDDHASFATAVGRDGTRIAGVSIGDDRVRPCVWERIAGSDPVAWRASPLPQAGPLLCSNVVALSPDGRLAVALDNGVPTLWTRRGDASWTREAIAPLGSMVPRAINDAAVVAGIAYPRDGSTHAVAWTRDKGLQPLAEPAGYTRSDAVAVNNAGIVVGMIDGPAGSPLAPRGYACDVAIGRLRILDEAGPHLAAATAINDRGQVAGVFEREDEGPAPPIKPAAPPAP